MGADDDRPAPGEMPILGAALAIGFLLLALQLWLLTIALDLYLGGSESAAWPLVAFSGLIFAGGLGTLWLLERARSRSVRG